MNIKITVKSSGKTKEIRNNILRKVLNSIDEEGCNL
jgi:hypothetical protein